MTSDPPTPLQLAARRLGDFRLSQRGDGYFAIASYPISPLLADHGCKGVLQADTIEALEQLCLAERMKRAKVLGAAEPHQLLPVPDEPA